MGLVYAPIIIPTLNRYEHLVRCITALQKNSWAEKTPLYISVDFPPAVKYEEGYQKICRYLKSGIKGFASVVIFYQEQNLGAYENEQFLLTQIRGKYDRYIFTEDDNDFSPNFIEYIDKGLEIFKENMDVIAICATGVSGMETKEANVVLSTNYCAHGCGLWFAKNDMMQEKINRKYFVEIAKSYSKMLALAGAHPSFLFAVQSAILRKERLYQMPNGEIPLIDMTKNIYMFFEKKYVITCLCKKARNWGYDGSGENCDNDKRAQIKNTQIEIDTRSHFEYVYSDFLQVRKIEKKYSLDILCRIIMVFIKLTGWRVRTLLTGDEDQ